MTGRRKAKQEVNSDNDQPKRVEEQSFSRPQHPLENSCIFLFTLRLLSLVNSPTRPPTDTLAPNFKGINSNES